MIITLNKDLPCIIELSCTEDEILPGLKAFYKTLNVKSEIILLTPFNMKKIIDYFNDEDKIKTLTKDLIEYYGLKNIATSDDIFLMDFELANLNINRIKTIQSIEITNTTVSEFVQNSKKDFLTLLKNSDSKGLMSAYSLYNENSIDIIHFENNYSSLSLKLKATYMLEGVDTSHLDYYKFEKVNYTVNVNHFNETRVSIEKTYHLKLNKELSHE